ncbi:MAG: hypothetical protein RLZZ502_1477, partial [Pseudomonadota bacterium]
DFTVLNLFALSQGMLTFSGPMAASDFGHPHNDPWTESECWRTLASLGMRVKVEAQNPYQGKTDGILWGSNLSNIVHLLGTPYFPFVQNGILLLEDIGEEAYAIDRMLMQLHHAGILKQQRALIFGHFNGVDSHTEAARAYPHGALAEVWRTRLDIPVVTGFPFGHVAYKATLPIGKTAVLDINPEHYTLEVQ